MTILRFDGEGAGLGLRRSGDANEVTSYTLLCGNGECSLELGPLGGYTENAEGQRSVCCPRCDMVTAVDENGQLVALVPGEIARMVKQAKAVEGDAR